MVPDRALSLMFSLVLGWAKCYQGCNFLRREEGGALQAFKSSDLTLNINGKQEKFVYEDFDRIFLFTQHGNREFEKYFMLVVVVIVVAVVVGQTVVI